MTGDIASKRTITQSIDDLAKTTQVLGDTLLTQVDKVRRLNFIMMGVGVVITVLVIFSIYSIIKLNAFAARSTADRAHINMVLDRTSNDVLCPLYELFLFSYNPKGPVALDNPALYEQNFDVIESGARVLNCKTQVRTHR